LGHASLLQAQPTQATATPSEDNPAVPAAGHSIHGAAFDDGPRSRAYLLPGQGHGGFLITVNDPEAQAYFNQGIAQIHTFYYLEAERSFRQAARIDPDAPMPYWGMAMANVNNDKRARGFIKEAQQRAGKVAVKLPRHEQLYLDGLGAFYQEKGEDKARRQEWVKALETIVQEFPDDADARSWLAMIVWQNSQKGDGIGSRQAVDELIESVLRIDPMHPGALHYRIHMWDGVKQERALDAAARYGPAAPGIAHAWHMPGHTYSGLQRYSDAAYQQEASARVDHAAMARDRTMPFDIHNYAHNNQWLCTSLSHIGRVRDAITVARDLVEQPRDPKRNNKTDGGSPQRNGRARWSELLVRYELWDDLIAVTEAEDLDWSDIPLEKKERAHTLGIAYAHKGERTKLVEQIDLLKSLQAPETKKDDTKADEKKDETKADEKKDAPKPDEKEAPTTPQDTPQNGANGGPRRSPIAPGVPSALAELEGYLAILDEQPDEALKKFEKATSLRPELKARAQLRAGQAEKAVATAKAAVERNVNQLPPLACLVEMYAAAGQTKEARDAYSRLRPLACEADADLPVMQRLAGLSARLEEVEKWSPTPARSGSADTGPARRHLETLGPLSWSPTPADAFALVDTEGTPWSLAEHRGRALVVLFYLGGKCAHCMQQLQEFGKASSEFQAMNVDLVAISTDDHGATKVLKQNAEDVSFPMPLLSNPGLEVFKKYRCFDDFEGAPLHGTFLIDANGGVRFSRVSAEPFLDVAFVKAEATRMKKLVRSGP
jgi:peroxiredoxin/tetratricopeptide (TPR) repeat protein